MELLHAVQMEALSILAPLDSLLGPPLANAASQQLLDTVKRVGFTMRSWSFRSDGSARFIVDDLRARLSRWMPSRVKPARRSRCRTAWSTTQKCRFTSGGLLSPKMARSSFSSGVSVVSPAGVTLPANFIAGLHFGAHVR